MHKVDNVRVTFGDKTVLDDVTIELAPREFVTLLGPNGVGKSTLLNVFAGLLLPDQGSITFNNESLENFGFSQVGRIGHINEDLKFFFIGKLSKFIKTLSSCCDKWDQQYFDKIITSLDLNIESSFDQYSRGQKVQMNVAMNLAMGKDIIFLDEVTSVLDSRARKIILDELKSFCDRGGTVLVTTNIIDELDFYSDRVIILKDGKISLDCNRNEISTEFVKVRIQPEDISEFEKNEDVVWSKINSDGTHTYIVNKSFKEFPENFLIDRRAATLEDIFIFNFSAARGLE